MERIRVLQVIPKLVTGGGQRVAMNLAEYLDRDKYEIEVLSLSPFSNEPFEEYLRHITVDVIYMNKKIGLDLKIFSDVDHLIKEFKPQVLHNHLHCLYVLLPSMHKHHIPVRIHTIHSVAIHEATGLHRIIQSIAFQKLKVIPVSISKIVQNSVLETYGKVFSPVIYNGVDPGKFSLTIAQRHNWREQNNVPMSAFVFVNVASFGPQKNQELLVRAFREVLVACPDAYLLLVGDGKLKSEVDRIVNEMCIENKVLSLGARVDIPQILNASDCFVLSSDWEGLPVSILEAMASSKAIITTNVGGIPELVTHELNGLLVPVGNLTELAMSMIRLYKDHSYATQMGISGRAIVEKEFDVHKMAEKYGELYLNTLRTK